MKRSLSIFKALTIIVLLAVATTIVCGCTVAEVHDFLASLTNAPLGVMFATGGLVAGATVTTEVAAAESPNLLRPDISKQITKIMPSAAPLDTLIRENGAHEKTDAIMFKFYSSELRGFEDTIASSFTNSNTTAPTSGEYEITVSGIHLWQVDDGVLFHGIEGGDGEDLVAHIVKKVNASSKLTVIFLNGDGTEGRVAPSSIPSETKIGRLGNAKSELDAKTDPYGHLPLDSYNFTQAHMAQVEESLWQKMHAKEVNWDIRDMQALSLFDLRCQMEATSLFGVRSKIYDSQDSDYKYTSGGAIRFITKKLTYTPGDIDNADFSNWTKNIFVGNAGSDNRYMFIGSDLNEELSNIPYVQKQIDGNSTEEKFGITFTKIETNFGILLVKHHPLFNYYGWSKNAIVLDMNNIRKRVFDPMKVRKLDLMSSGLKKANAFVLEETFGLEFRYPDTHAIIKPSGGTQA